MNDEEILKLVGYVMASEYRSKIIKCIGDNIKIPSAIASEIGLRTNHVSNVLKDLKEKNLVICLNEEARKGRLYRNTQLGLNVLKFL
ncbi:transcriptional regulator [Methanobrevibacter sp.]